MKTNILLNACTRIVHWVNTSLCPVGENAKYVITDKKNAAFVRVRKSDTVVHHNDGELIDPGIVIMPLSLSTWRSV